jgi:hypothetical protein
MAYIRATGHTVPLMI